MKKNILLNISLSLTIYGFGQNDSTKFDTQLINLKNNKYEIISFSSDNYILSGKLDTTNYNVSDSVYFDIKLIDFESKNDIYGLESKLFCDSNNNFCMPTNVIIEKDSNRISLIHVMKIPFKNKSESIIINVFKNNLFLEENKIVAFSQEFILNTSLNYSPSANVFLEYRKIKKEGIDKYLTNEAGIDYLVDFIDRFFVDSFFNEKNRCLFVNLKNDLPEFTEGILGEVYYSWAIIYNIYAKENNKPKINF